MKYVICIIIGLVITSCSDSDKQSDHDGTELDSLNEQYWTKYHDNGEIKERVGIKDEAWHGKYTSYYSSGNPKMQLEYYKGKKRFGFYEYYNALDTFIAMYDGEYRVFTEPMIKRYGFFNSNEDVAFELKYNEQGVIINKFGKAIIEYYQPSELDDNYVGLFQFILPNPPKTVVKFELIDNNRSGRLIYNESLQNNRVLIEYHHKFAIDDSVYSWKAFSTVFDEEGGNLFVDSITFKERVPRPVRDKADSAKYDIK